MSAVTALKLLFVVLTMRLLYLGEDVIKNVPRHPSLVHRHLVVWRPQRPKGLTPPGWRQLSVKAAMDDIALEPGRRVLDINGKGHQMTGRFESKTTRRSLANPRSRGDLCGEAQGRSACMLMPFF